MIDTHAHLNIEDFKEDIDKVIQNAKDNNVKRIIVIGMDDASNKRAIKLSLKYEMVYATVGIHPGYVENGDAKNIIQYLNHPKVVAIGECGLDFYWTKDNVEEQKEIFKQQIILAKTYKLPLVIHTRNSFTEAYDMLKPYKGMVYGVFHCFSSNLEDAKKAIDLGFYIGIDGPVTFKKNEDLKAIIEHIDLNHILIETDSPYMAPVPYRGKRNEPAHLKYVAQKIAEIKKISLQSVVDITTVNSYQLFYKMEDHL